MNIKFQINILGCGVMVTQQSLKLQASEAVVPGSNPGTPTKITIELVC